MNTVTKARYDGLADWYDDRFIVGAEPHQPTRVLRPGGVLVVYGVHPAFNGPHVIYNEDDSRTIHPTYRQGGWHQDSPAWGEDGIRRRVGMHHVPLAEYLNAFLATGLILERFIEPDGPGIPHALAVRATKPV